MKKDSKSKRVSSIQQEKTDFMSNPLWFRENVQGMGPDVLGTEFKL